MFSCDNWAKQSTLRRTSPSENGSLCGCASLVVVVRPRVVQLRIVVNEYSILMRTVAIQSNVLPRDACARAAPQHKGRRHTLTGPAWPSIKTIFFWFSTLAFSNCWPDIDSNGSQQAVCTVWIVNQPSFSFQGIHYWFAQNSKLRPHGGLWKASGQDGSLGQQCLLAKLLTQFGDSNRTEV